VDALSLISFRTTISVPPVEIYERMELKNP